jgi:hypothetical protein
MARRIKPYTLADAGQLFTAAKKAAGTRHERWRVYENQYRSGTHLSDGDPTANLGERAALNVALPHLTVMMGATIARDPQFVVDSAFPSADGRDEVWAKVASELLHSKWHDAHATRAHKRAAQDKYILGVGFTKTVWVEDEVTVWLDEDAIEEAIVELVADEADQALLEGRRALSREELLERYEIPSYTTVTLGTPHTEWVSPFNLFVPEDATCLDDARWIAQVVRTTRSEVEANDQFRNTDNLRPAVVSATAWSNEPGRHHQWLAEVGPDSMVEYVEFYDLRTRTLLVFQDGSDKPLYEGPMPWKHGSHPFSEDRGFESGTGFWPFGDLENIAPLCEALNDVFSERMANLRRAGTNWIVRGEFATPELMRLLGEKGSGRYQTINGLPQGASFEDLFIPVRVDDLNPALFDAAQESLEEAVRRTLGVNDFQAGGVGADRMSATAVAVVDGTATLRAQEKITATERSLETTARLILALCQENMDAEDVVKVVGTDGSAWVEVDEATLVGDYGVTISGGSTRSINPTTREQRGLRFIREIAPLLAQMGYDPEPGMRQAIIDMGQDPDQILQRAEPPAEAAPQGPEGMPAEAGMDAMGAAGLPPEAAGLGGGGGELDFDQIAAMLGEGGPSEAVGGLPDDAEFGGEQLL